MKHAPCSKNDSKRLQFLMHFRSTFWGHPVYLFSCTPQKRVFVKQHFTYVFDRYKWKDRADGFRKWIENESKNSKNDAKRLQFLINFRSTFWGHPLYLFTCTPQKRVFVKQHFTYVFERYKWKDRPDGLRKWIENASKIVVFWHHFCCYKVSLCIPTEPRMRWYKWNLPFRNYNIYRNGVWLVPPRRGSLYGGGGGRKYLPEAIKMMQRDHIFWCSFDPLSETIRSIFSLVPLKNDCVRNNILLTFLNGTSEKIERMASESGSKMHQKI